MTILQTSQENKVLKIKQKKHIWAFTDFSVCYPYQGARSKISIDVGMTYLCYIFRTYVERYNQESQDTCSYKARSPYALLLKMKGS